MSHAHLVQLNVHCRSSAQGAGFFFRIIGFLLQNCAWCTTTHRNQRLSPAVFARALSKLAFSEVHLWRLNTNRQADMVGHPSMESTGLRTFNVFLANRTGTLECAVNETLCICISSHKFAFTFKSPCPQNTARCMKDCTLGGFILCTWAFVSFYAATSKSLFMKERQK